MRLPKPIRAAIPLILWIGLTGCIHTYPSPEEAVDPTEIEAVLLLHFQEEWTDNEFRIEKEPQVRLSGDTRTDEWTRRIYLEIKGEGEKQHTLTGTATDEEMAQGIYALRLPFKLKANSYKISVWTDYIDPVTTEPLGYDISNTNVIRELLPRGEESDRRRCMSATSELNLRHLAGQWDSKVEHEITLSTPMARVRLIADDYNEFLAETEEARRRGEKYYITVAYDSEIPGAFSLPDGTAMDPVSNASFSSQLPILTFPGITEMSIGSDWLFNPASEHWHTVTVSIFNSAKAMVSQAAGISFPTQRGHITTVKGHLLTNFVKGGIQIDNLWAGEIVIEI